MTVEEIVTAIQAERRQAAEALRVDDPERAARHQQQERRLLARLWPHIQPLARGLAQRFGRYVRACVALDCDDLETEGFLSAWRALDRYEEGRGRVRPFLARVISNHYRSLARRKCREQPAGDLLDQLAGTGANALARWVEEIEEVMLRRNRCRPLAVRIFRLARAGHTLQQIGAQVGLGSTEVHRRLCEARAAFAEMARQDRGAGG